VTSIHQTYEGAHGLLVTYPWSQYMVRGLKTIETRHTPLPIPWSDTQWVAIIETYSTTTRTREPCLVGFVRFSTNVIVYDNELQWIHDYPQHGVTPTHEQFSWQVGLTKWNEYASRPHPKQTTRKSTTSKRTPPSSSSSTQTTLPTTQASSRQQQKKRRATSDNDDDDDDNDKAKLNDNINGKKKRSRSTSTTSSTTTSDTESVSSSTSSSTKPTLPASSYAKYVKYGYRVIPSSIIRLPQVIPRTFKASKKATLSRQVWRNDHSMSPWIFNLFDTHTTPK
jgi:hypothetical protein